MSLQDSKGLAQPLRVLIVDDEPITRSLVAKKVALLNVETCEAEDGAAAWQVLHDQDIHLAIIDLEMPHLDGFELLQCMRGHPRTRHIPAIVLTWREDKKSIERALSAGATSFLAKPLNWTLFGDHIRHVMGVARMAEAARAVSQVA